MSIKVVTDSTSYISEEIIRKYDISIATLNVTLGNESFREVDIDKVVFYDKMANSKEMPTSSQPNIKELYELFEKIVVQGAEVLGIFISSDMSGTYSTAHLVKEMILEDYPKASIEIVDSRSNCMQMGFAAIAAARVAKDGGTMEEALAAANNVIGKSRFLFVPDTLEYLKKGGRIGGASALLGTILQIKPILTVEEGKTTVLDKVRTKKKALEKIITAFLEDINKKGLGEVVVHHINCKEEGLELASKLEKTLGIPVAIYDIGPVIGLHVGPGTLGIVYYTKE